MTVVTEPARIKFCGITTLPDAERAVEYGAWAIGLNFWPGTARRVELQTATEIGGALKRRVEIAGVFVNPTLEEVAAIAEQVGLTMLQLHGDEGPVFCAEAARRTGCKVIKAVRVRSGADLQALEAFHTDYHLLDSYLPGLRGGTGEAFAWELTRQHRGNAPLLLSGGLTPENVAEAIAIVRPYAVDVASGVEREPGIKDPEKMRAFAESVSGAAAPVPASPR